ncbi:MAG: adenine deaminase [Calditrichaeota bacterium]|nr:adenine deaminase [Calditrichota bacterium]
MKIQEMQELLAVSRGDKPADFLLKNARIVNTASCEIIETSVAIFGRHIAGLGDYEARHAEDLKGAFLAPSFLDGHIHLESSLLSPDQFARVVVPHGTGGVVWDPHEFANVLGGKGIEFVLNSTENLPLSVWVMLPSCVPATHMETAGASLSAEDLRPFLPHPRVIGIAEVMNFPGVIFGDPGVLAKVEIAAGRPLDGHAPGLGGKSLQAYLAAGIATDHECTTLDEAREKLRGGMAILIREGSTAKNLETLLPLIRPETARRFAFVSDDRHADDLLGEGHMDAILRKAVALGLPPILAVQLATINTAQIFARKDVGLIAPGKLANLVQLEDLKNFKVIRVWHEGKLAAAEGEPLISLPPLPVQGVTDAVCLSDISIEDLAVPAASGPVRVIDLIPNQIVTGASTAKLPTENGKLQADSSQDIAKLVVVERHGKSGDIGKGFVRGFGLRSGALASSVAHDSHNIVCAGMSDNDMLLAVKTLKKLGGGLCVVNNGKALAELALPIAGLVSDKPAREVIESLAKVDKAAKSLGVKVHAPFMALSFLALPVIPHLKLTDKGLVDVDAFQIVPLPVESK